MKYLSIEALSGEEIKQRTIGWSVAALVSLGVMAGGIYGWSNQGKDPLSVSCRGLTAQADNLEDTLLNEGVLGWGGGSAIRYYIETRKANDPRLEILGSLKNQRDQICSEVRKRYEESSDGLVRVGAIGGGALALFSLRNAVFFGRRLRSIRT